MAPNTAPAPELGCCTTIGWLLHTWRGTATCWITGVLEITRPDLFNGEDRAGASQQPYR